MGRLIGVVAERLDQDGKWGPDRRSCREIRSGWKIRGLIGVVAGKLDLDAKKRRLTGVVAEKLDLDGKLFFFLAQAALARSSDGQKMSVACQCEESALVSRTGYSCSNYAKRGQWVKWEARTTTEKATKQTKQTKTPKTQKHENKHPKNTSPRDPVN